MITTPKTVGFRLKWLRKVKKLSMEQLCEQAGISKGNYSKIERGLGQNTSVYTMAKICEVLGTNLSDLYMED